MAKKYAKAIKAGTKTIDDVPQRWREEVRRVVNEDDA